MLCLRSSNLDGKTSPRSSIAKATECDCASSAAAAAGWTPAAQPGSAGANPADQKFVTDGRRATSYLPASFKLVLSGKNRPRLRVKNSIGSNSSGADRNQGAV